jgi:hypothetical protein
MSAQHPPIETLADVKDLYRKPPETDLTPEKARRIQSLGDRPVGESFGHHRIDSGEHFEEVEPTRGLQEGYRWFLPGLAYCLVGMDQSFLALYRAGRRQELKPKTHRAQDLLLRFGNKTSSKEPWLYCLQGVPEPDWEGFRDFVTTYRIKTTRGETWTLSWEEARMPDPLRGGAPLVVQVLLPKNHLTGRRFTTVEYNRVFPTPGVGLQVVQDLT